MRSITIIAILCCWATLSNAKIISASEFIYCYAPSEEVMKRFSKMIYDIVKEGNAVVFLADEVVRPSETKRTRGFFLKPTDLHDCKLDLYTKQYLCKFHEVNVDYSVVPSNIPKVRDAELIGRLVNYGLTKADYDALLIAMADAVKDAACCPGLTETGICSLETEDHVTIPGLGKMGFQAVKNQFLFSNSFNYLTPYTFPLIAPPPIDCSIDYVNPVYSKLETTCLDEKCPFGSGNAIPITVFSSGENNYAGYPGLGNTPLYTDSKNYTDDVNTGVGNILSTYRAFHVSKPNTILEITRAPETHVFLIPKPTTIVTPTNSPSSTTNAYMLNVGDYIIQQNTYRNVVGAGGYIVTTPGDVICTGNYPLFSNLDAQYEFYNYVDLCDGFMRFATLLPPSTIGKAVRFTVSPQTFKLSATYLFNGSTTVKGPTAMVLVESADKLKFLPDKPDTNYELYVYPPTTLPESTTHFSITSAEEEIPPCIFPHIIGEPSSVPYTTALACPSETISFTFYVDSTMVDDKIKLSFYPSNTLNLKVMKDNITVFFQDSDAASNQYDITVSSVGFYTVNLKKSSYVTVPSTISMSSTLVSCRALTATNPGFYSGSFIDSCRSNKTPNFAAVTYLLTLENSGLIGIRGGDGYHDPTTPINTVSHPNGYLKIFSSGGLLLYENDNGGIFGNDAYLLLDSPANGTYTVELTDTSWSSNNVNDKYLFIVQPVMATINCENSIDMSTSFGVTKPIFIRGILQNTVADCTGGKRLSAASQFFTLTNVAPGTKFYAYTASDSDLVAYLTANTKTGTQLDYNDDTFASQPLITVLSSTDQTMVLQINTYREPPATPKIYNLFIQAFKPGGV